MGGDLYVGHAEQHVENALDGAWNPAADVIDVAAIRKAHHLVVGTHDIAHVGEIPLGDHISKADHRFLLTGLDLSNLARKAGNHVIGILLRANVVEWPDNPAHPAHGCNDIAVPVFRLLTC